MRHHHRFLAPFGYLWTIFLPRGVKYSLLQQNVNLHIHSPIRILQVNNLIHVDLYENPKICSRTLITCNEMIEFDQVVLV